MTTLSSYSSMGGSLQPTIDHRAYPFEDSLEVPLTVKEIRYENYSPISSLTGITSATTSRIEFNVPAVSDQSMYNLKDSYVQFAIAVPTLAGNQGLTMMASNALVPDVQVYFGSVLVSEPHSGGMYPWQAFVKDMLTRPTAAALSNYTGTDMKRNTIEELEFISTGTGYSSIRCADDGGGGAGSGAPNFIGATKVYCTNSTIYIRFRIHDGIFQTSKFFPANMNLRIVLTLKLMNAFQENPGSTQVSGGAVTLSDAQFLLSRVFLSDDSLRAQNQALMRSPLKYILPYSKVETKMVQSGQTFFNVNGLFQSQTKPDLVAILFQNSTTDKTWPFFACGAAPANGSTNMINAPAASSLYVRWNGRQYPAPTCSPLNSADIRSYDAYVSQCLEDESPFLPYLNWTRHFTVYYISLRDDGEKMFGKAPMLETGSLEILCNFTAATTTAATMYAIALTHCKLEISDQAIVQKINYIN